MLRNNTLLATLRLVLPLALTVGILSARSDRGTITGSVTDQANAAVPGARITVTHVATKVCPKS